MPALALLAAASLVAAPARPAAASAPDPLRTAADAYRAVSALAAGEPTIAEVQAAAARRVAGPRDSAASFAGRARLAALLPRLTAEVRLDQSSQRIVGLQGAGEVDYLRRSPGTVLALRATWDLGRLVASPGELAGDAARAARARRQDEAVRSATALFYERRKLRLELWLDPPEDSLDRARIELEVDRLGAELDALTGGLFTRGGP